MTTSADGGHYFRAWRHVERIHDKLYQWVEMSVRDGMRPSARWSWIVNRWRLPRWSLVSRIWCSQACHCDVCAHLLVDMGLVVMVVVTAASVTEWEGRQVFALLHQLRSCSRVLARIWVDGRLSGRRFMQGDDTYRWSWRSSDGEVRSQGVWGATRHRCGGGTHVWLVQLVSALKQGLRNSPENSLQAFIHPMFSAHRPLSCW